MRKQVYISGRGRRSFVDIEDRSMLAREGCSATAGNQMVRDYVERIVLKLESEGAAEGRIF